MTTREWFATGGGDQRTQAEEEEIRKAYEKQTAAITDGIIKALAVLMFVVMLGLLVWGCSGIIKRMSAENPTNVMVISKGIRPEKQYRTECGPTVTLDFDGNMKVVERCRRVFSHWEDIASYVWAGCTTDAGGAIVPLSREGEYSYSTLVSEGKTSDHKYRCSGRVVVSHAELEETEKLSWRTFQ